MTVEFYHPQQANVFSATDFIKVGNQPWRRPEELAAVEIDIIYRQLTANDDVMKYLRYIAQRGITNRVLQIVHIGRRFFGKLTREADIDENAQLHFETR